MAEEKTAFQNLLTYGVAFGSQFYGGIIGNLVASVLWEGGKWVVLNKLPDLTTLLKQGGSNNNHDLLRALRRAECHTVVSLCDQALREDFGLSTDSLKDRLKSWLHERKDPEGRAVCYIRRVFAQQHSDLQSLSVEKLLQLHGAAVADVPVMIKAGSECFAASSPDQLREYVVRQQVEVLDVAARGILGQAGAKDAEFRTFAFDVGLPPSLKRRITQHPQGWWDLLRLAFREELKDNERARIAWEMDVLSLLPQQLGSNYNDFEKKFSALDGNLTGVWNDLRSFRRVFDDATALLEDINETTSATRSELGQLREETRKGFEQVTESMKQRPQRPPLQLPKRALAGKLFGRVAQLRQLVERLSCREHVDIWGPAGMGKSALAAEAIHVVVGDNPDNLSTTPYPDGVVLLDLYSLKFTSPDPAWHQLANAFDESLPTSLGARERVLTACRGRRALVVVEGAEEAGDGRTLQKLLEVLAPETTRLVLTRDKRQVSTAKPLNVEAALSDDEALALLRELCGHTTDEATIVRVHERLGGHPLALTWAGLQLGAGEEPPRAFVNALTSAQLPNLHEPSYEDHTLRWLYDRSVKRLTPEARQVLTAAGLLAQQPFPLSAALAVLHTQETPAREALKSLARYGLLRITSSEEDYWEFTHALTHQFAHSTGDDTLLSSLGVWAIAHFTYAVESVRRTREFLPLGHALNHASALLRADCDATALNALQFKLLYDGLDQINMLGRLDLARIAIVPIHEWLQRGLTLRPDDVALQRELSVSHDRVGDVLVAQGQLEQALTAYTASRTIRERLAEQDPHNAEWQRDLSISHNRVGDVLVAQGQLEQALTAYTASRTIR